jgi:hypothetical protein
MPCATHQQLKSDAEQAEAILKNLSVLKMSHPNTVRDDDFGRFSGLLADANDKLRNHVTTCPDCAAESHHRSG